MLLHIANDEVWATAVANGGDYAPASLAEQGFVHCSYPWQLAEVANRRFADRARLQVLVIDEGRLPVEVRVEGVEDIRERFPHVYGPVPVGAVVAVAEWRPGADGAFRLPVSA